MPSTAPTSNDTDVRRAGVAACFGIMGDDFLTPSGERDIWGGAQPFGISSADRRQHLYCIGKSGAGKSTLLRNLLIRDIWAGRGAGLIDPHGDLAEELLDHIPRWRSEDVVYFDAADVDHPISFNLLRQVDPSIRHLIASGIITSFKNLFRESWGPRLEYIFFATIAALLECSNTSLLGVQRMFVDSAYRAWVTKQVTDPVIRAFWTNEFEHYDPRFMREAVAPIQNKVGQLLMSAPVRNILGQIKSKIDPAFIMDRRRIFIANLAKGRIGEDKANLLGSVLLTQFQLAAMRRVTVREKDRQDFTLFIDEFQNFSTDAFASVLSESRKYHLSLALFHQHIEQLSDAVRNAVFGNCGTLISFRVGESNAAQLAREFGNVYQPSVFSSLDNFEICVRLLSGGRQLEPFLGRTYPPIGQRFGRKEKIVRRSRERYSRPRALVERKVEQWMRRNW